MRWIERNLELKRSKDRKSEREEEEDEAFDDSVDLFIFEVK